MEEAIGWVQALSKSHERRVGDRDSSGFEGRGFGPELTPELSEAGRSFFVPALRKTSAIAALGIALKTTGNVEVNFFKKDIYEKSTWSSKRHTRSNGPRRYLSLEANDGLGLQMTPGACT